MRKYTAELLDQEGKPLVFLENANNIVMQGFRLNQPNTPAFVFPLNNKKLEYLSMARRFRIYRDGSLLYSGKIDSRDTNEANGVVAFKGITNEIELSRLLTPGDWTHLNGRDLADAVRYLHKGWETVRINTYEEWLNYIVYSENLDGIDPDPVDNTDPGKLFISRKRVTYHVPELEENRNVDQFHPYALARVEIPIPSDVTEAEVIRWTQVVGEAKDDEEKVEGTYVEYRYQFSINGGGTWSGWSDWFGKNAVSDYPEKEGFAIPITGLNPGNSNILQIEMKLVTENVTAPAIDWEDLGDGDINTLGITPELHAVEVIFRKPWIITEGSIPASTNITVDGFELNRETHLDIIQQLCEEYGYEWRINDDLTLDLAQKFGKVHELPFISGENCTISNLSDNMEVINVVECLGMGEGPNQLRVVVRHEESIQKYGEYPASFEDTSIDNVEYLQSLGEKELQPEPPQKFGIEIPYDSDLPFIDIGDTITLLITRGLLETTGRVVEWSGGEAKKGEIIKVSLDSPQANIMDHIIKPKKLKRRTQTKVDPPAVRAKGGFWFVRIWWSGNADHYIVQRTETPTISSSWRNTGGKIKEKTYFLRVPLFKKIYLRVAAVKRNKTSKWSNIVSAYSSPWKTFVDDSGKVVFDLRKKHLNGLHVKNNLGETVLDPDSKTLNINEIKDESGSAVLNAKNKEAFGLHLKDALGNSMLDPDAKKIKGMSLEDGTGNEVVNPITKIIKAKKLYDTTGNPVIDSETKEAFDLHIKDRQGNTVLDPINKTINAKKINDEAGNVVIDPTNKEAFDLNIKDAVGNTVIDTTLKKMKGMNITDDDDNDVIDPKNKIISAKQINDDVGNPIIRVNPGGADINGRLGVTGDIESNGIRVPVMRRVTIGSIWSTGVVNKDIELNITEYPDNTLQRQPMLVWFVRADGDRRVVLGYSENERCAYIETRTRPSKPVLWLKSRTSHTEMFYEVYELLI